MAYEDVTVLVTGAGGFIGGMVVDDLASSAQIVIDGRETSIGRIVVNDIASGSFDALDDRHEAVSALPGDLADAAVRRAIVDLKPDAVVHLAAVVSSAAEADFDLGLDVNIRSLMDLLSAFQDAGHKPVFLFTSSVAVFSAPGNAAIDETLEPKPLSSYGMQKVVGELLVRDASRRGIVQGRSIRFPTISIRPGTPNKAASSFASGLVREPLKGVEALLPVPRDTRLYLASPRTAVASVRHALGLQQAAIGLETTITLPGLSVTVDEMIAALEAAAGADTVAKITDRPDREIAAIVSTWPGRIATPRAEELGFAADAAFEDLIGEYMSQHMGRSAADQGQ